MASRETRTIQATAKRWKACQGFGWLLALGSIPLLGIDDRLAIAAAVVGLGLVFFGKLAGWWHHG